MRAAVGNWRVELGEARQAWRAAHRLRRAAASARTASEIVDAALAASQGPMRIAPLQVRSEIVELVELVRADKPQRVLEVGTALGGTLYLLAWAARPGAHVLSLERRLYPRARRQLYRMFVGGRTVDVLEADSHLESTRRRVEDFFHGDPIDVLFVDGAHHWDSVSQDYELYAPLVRPGGLIAFHDIVDGPGDAVGDVPRFWREVRGSLDDPVELVESWDQGGFGIGVGRRLLETSRPQQSV